MASTRKTDIPIAAYSGGELQAVVEHCAVQHPTVVVVAHSPRHRSVALALRLQVFVEEQGVPESLERDDQDRVATHFLAYQGLDPVGTARSISVDAETIKVGRVAVRAESRGQGVGVKLMEAAEATARAAGFTQVVLSAQEPVVGFYERLGYRTVSERFFEAGIPHFKMTKKL